MPSDYENQETAAAQGLLREMLDRDWREADVRRAAELAAALDTCPEALAAVRETDAIRESLQAPELNEDVEPIGGWQAFETRMHNAVAHRINQPLESPSARAETRDAADGPGTSRSTSKYRITPIHAAIAASVLLLVGVGVGHIASRSAPVNPFPWTAAGLAHRVDTKPSPIPSAEETNRQVAAFHEVARTLDNRASWMTLGGTPQVGLASTPLAPDARPLLVRLVASHNGRTIAAHDIVIIAGQEAQLTLPIDHGEIRYIITTRDSDPIQVSLWSELIEPGRSPKVLAALATHIHARPGDVRSAGEMVTTSGEYRIQLGIHESNQKMGRTYEPFREATP